MQSGNILELTRGLYYAHPTCTNLPPDDSQAFWIDVNYVDSSYKIIEAVPASTALHYFYKAKMYNNAWGGWEKYLAQ